MGDYQVLFNIAASIVGMLVGIVLTMVWSMVKTLQSADIVLADKVQKIEVLVAGNYVTRPELEKYIQAMFHKLDIIEEKLDKKVDKGG